MDNYPNMEYDQYSQITKGATVISVFGLRGGVGKTTLAVNLAAAFNQLWQMKVGLVDMALDTGHCSLMLNLKPKATLASLVNWDAPVDSDVVNDLLCEHECGVVLLPAADTPTEGEFINPGMLDSIWDDLKSRFPYLVIDAGSSFNESSLFVLDRSDLIILVFTPELASVKSTTDALQLFRDFGYPDKKILPVANWTFPSNNLLLTRITQILKVNIAAEIPFDSPGFIQAVNTGRPPVLATPSTPAADAILRMAYRISHKDMESRGLVFTSPILARMRK